MNNNRRKTIRSVIKELEEIKEKISEIYDEQDEYLDNMPENMQDGERFAFGDEARDNLEYAGDTVDDVIDYLTQAAE